MCSAILLKGLIPAGFCLPLLSMKNLHYIHFAEFQLWDLETLQEKALLPPNVVKQYGRRKKENPLKRRSQCYKYAKCSFHLLAGHSKKLMA